MMLTKILEILNVVIGLGNLGFYAWGEHAPASLAIGIACLFAASWASKT